MLNKVNNMIDKYLYIHTWMNQDVPFDPFKNKIHERADKQLVV